MPVVGDAQGFVAALRDARRNNGAGVALDDGSSINFAQTVPVSGVQTSITGNHPDLLVTFASRATTLPNDTINAVSCDATALIRGSLGVTCPH
jgi:hypothetical protein